MYFTAHIDENVRMQTFLCKNRSLHTQEKYIWNHAGNMSRVWLSSQQKHASWFHYDIIRTVFWGKCCRMGFVL